MRRAWLVLWIALAGCATAPLQRGRTDLAPAVDDWGPHPGAPLEWWYVSSASPEAGLAFHVAFFRAHLPPEQRVLGIPVHRLFPGAYAIAHVSVTDLRTGERYLRARTDFPFGYARTAGEPLRLELGPWRLVEGGEQGRFTLRAGPLSLDLAVEKPPTVHPPGWSGSASLGRMAYQSIPRLRYEGTWRDRPVSGTAWMDHQWGEVIPLRDARWDWHGLHLSDGTDLMLYALSRPDGTHPCVQVTTTDAAGTTRALPEARLTPRSTWRSAQGRLYVVGWTLTLPGDSLTIRPLRLDQELVTIPGIPYWEGPVVVEGTFRGRAVRGVGMGEHLPWPEGVPSAPACGTRGARR